MSKIFLGNGNTAASSSSSSAAFLELIISASRTSFSSPSSSNSLSSSESSKAYSTSLTNLLLFFLFSFSFSSSSLTLNLLSFALFTPLSPSSSKSSSLDSFAIVLTSHFILSLQNSLSCGAANNTEYPLTDCINTDNNSLLFDQVKLVNTNRFMVVSCNIRILPPPSRGSHVNIDLLSHTANLYFRCFDS